MSTTKAIPQSLTFRLATLENTRKITRLINEAFRSEETGQTWLYESQDQRIDIVTEELISTFISSPDTVMLVGMNSSSNDPVTSCYIRKPAPVSPPHITPGSAWLGFLTVLPNIHKRGYGLAMLQEAERYVYEEWHIKRLELDHVSTRKQLRAWYERCGYLATGAKRGFIYAEGTRNIFAEGLEMIVLGKDLTSRDG